MITFIFQRLPSTWGMGDFKILSVLAFWLSFRFLLPNKYGRIRKMQILGSINGFLIFYTFLKDLSVNIFQEVFNAHIRERRRERERERERQQQCKPTSPWTFTDPVGQDQSLRLLLLAAFGGPWGSTEALAIAPAQENLGMYILPLLSLCTPAKGLH